MPLASPKQRLPFLLVMLAVLLVAAWWLRSARQTRPSRTAFDPQFFAQVQALDAREQALDATVWAPDLVADECGRVFEELWDALNASTNALQTLAGIALPEILTPTSAPARDIGNGIQWIESTGAGAVWNAAQWQAWLEAQRVAGWQLVQSEFRHWQFDPAPSGRPLRSRFFVNFNLMNAALDSRATMSGDLGVEWSPDTPVGERPQVRRIDASGLNWRVRRGPPPFELILDERVQPKPKSFFIDPLLVYDLDGDGYAEILLAASNLLYRREPDGRYRSEPLCRDDPGLIFSAVLADFDGDGHVDLLCARFAGLVLYRGSARGTFDEPGRVVWSVTPHLKFGQVLTCGDVDGDGDLDVWLGQYKVPYRDGQMPTPFYDANDGFPSYLLRNYGHGNFTDATEAASLATKRWRRNYAASLVDLNGDGALDLLTVNDFAGVDCFVNDGLGHFTDVTGGRIAEPRGFGMAHAFADFDGDGRLDLLVTGMHCATATRLAHLNLTRPEQPDYTTERASMVRGTKLYLGDGGQHFALGALSESIARSGWSWGCSAFDADNDGFPDVYVATGHETRENVRDYEPEFWRHDIYAGTSRENPVVAGYFGAKISRTRGRGQSYGGYEKNRLFLNLAGKRFVETAHLFGVALEQDSRNVVAADLDGDGRVDLLTTTFEAWPEVKQTLKVYRNQLEGAGHWIGVRLREPGGGASVMGAVVRVRAGGRTFVRPVVSGDSFRSQHAPTVHFGLGANAAVDFLEVRWPDGKTNRLEHPAADCYHAIERR